jgi:hypothetical protein
MLTSPCASVRSTKTRPSAEIPRVTRPENGLTVEALSRDACTARMSAVHTRPSLLVRHGAGGCALGDDTCTATVVSRSTTITTPGTSLGSRWHASTSVLSAWSTIQEAWVSRSTSCNPLAPVMRRSRRRCSRAMTPTTMTATASGMQVARVVSMGLYRSMRL